MPTQTREYSLFSPGNLVKNIADIYSSPPIDGDHNTNRIRGGTIGVIISGPDKEKGYPQHCQVQFLNNIMWWVGFHEIEPYIKEAHQ